MAETQTQPQSPADRTAVEERQKRDHPRYVQAQLAGKVSELRVKAQSGACNQCRLAASIAYNGTNLPTLPIDGCTGVGDGYCNCAFVAIAEYAIHLKSRARGAEHRRYCWGRHHHSCVEWAPSDFDTSGYSRGVANSDKGISGSERAARRRGRTRIHSGSGV